MYFILPLDDSVWDENTLNSDSVFTRKLFVSFVVSIVDNTGKRVMSNMKTITPISRLNTISMCEEDIRADGSFEDVVEIDVLLGLAPSRELYNTSVLESLDITRTTTPPTLKRDVSTKESNSMTVLVKGSHDLFNSSYASKYTLEVEDMITIHILSNALKTEVESLISSDEAFMKVVDPESNSKMRLMPSNDLLRI